LVLAAIVTGAGTRPAEASTGREDQMRAEIAQFLNAERAYRGLSELYFDRNLQESAQAWAERNRSVGCEPPTDCHSPGAEAEILAWGGPDSKTGAIVVAWMRSHDHRNIALHPRGTSLGVGFACSSAGQVFAVVQFGGVRKPVVATEENPIATAPDHGSACVGAAGPEPRQQRVAPPSTAATTAPPTTAAPAPAMVRRTPAPSAPATTTLTTPPPTSLATTTTAYDPAPVIRLSSVAPELTVGEVPPEVDVGDQALLSETPAGPPPAEPAWIAVLVVVVLLSALRVAGAVRDRAKESAHRLGL
jgi:hypothetical protein